MKPDQLAIGNLYYRLYKNSEYKIFVYLGIAKRSMRYDNIKYVSLVDYEFLEGKTIKHHSFISLQYLRPIEELLLKKRKKNSK